MRKFRWPPEQALADFACSGGETRTLNLVVNSHPLCLLSYPGRPPTRLAGRARRAGPPGSVGPQGRLTPPGLPASQPAGRAPQPLR